MRTIAILSAVVALLSSILTASAQEADKTPETVSQMTFEVLEHDFGTLSLHGESASFDFEFTNTGKAPLVVIRTQTSCNCIRVKFPRRPVAAGEKGTITVTYNPTKETGAFNKGVHIFTNSPERQQTLFVKGVVE